MTVVLGIIQLNVAATAAAAPTAAATVSVAAVIISITSTSSIAIAQTVDHVAVQHWFNPIGEIISPDYSIERVEYARMHTRFYRTYLIILFKQDITTKQKKRTKKKNHKRSKRTTQ